jgi:hypothetical protein
MNDTSRKGNRKAQRSLAQHFRRGNTTVKTGAMFPSIMGDFLMGRENAVPARTRNQITDNRGFNVNDFHLSAGRINRPFAMSKSGKRPTNSL